MGPTRELFLKLVLELCLSAPPDLRADPSRFWKGPNERAHVDTISEDARADGEVDFKHSCPCTGRTVVLAQGICKPDH